MTWSLVPSWHDPIPQYPKCSSRLVAAYWGKALVIASVSQEILLRTNQFRFSKFELCEQESPQLNNWSGQLFRGHLVVNASILEMASVSHTLAAHTRHQPSYN